MPEYEKGTMSLKSNRLVHQKQALDCVFDYELYELLH